MGRGWGECSRSLVHADDNMCMLGVEVTCIDHDAGETKESKEKPNG